MSQGEAMSENEATEGGVIFEELSTVRCYIVDGGSGSERACKAPGILLERGRGGIRSHMVSAAVASGRLGSEEMRVGRPSTVERIITRREEL